MNRKKYGIALGAVAIVLMMMSTATATTTHIDSNIKITKKQLQQLNDAYNNIDEGDIKILLGKIIDLLQTKKVVNSEDIKTIIGQNNLNRIPGVYFLRCIDTGPGDWTYCPGDCGPHLFRNYWGSFFYWQARQSDEPMNRITVRVGPDTYNCDHNGLDISFHR